MVLKNNIEDNPLDLTSILTTSSFCAEFVPRQHAATLYILLYQTAVKIKIFIISKSPFVTEVFPLDNSIQKES